MGLELLISFGAGLVGFLSPCVLPLLPGYVGYMTGASAGEKVPLRQALPGTLAFVGGITIVFVSMGATASAISAVLLDHRSLLRTLSGVFIVVLGALMLLGAAGPELVASLERRAPRLARPLRATMRIMPFFWRERRVRVRPRVGPLAAFGLGAAFAFGWTPCIGPTLGAALNFAATAEHMREGIALLGAYSAGIGLPFVAAGLGLVAFGGRTKRYAATIQAAGGVVLVGVGILVVTGQLTLITRWMQRILAGANLDFWNI